MPCFGNFFFMSKGRHSLGVLVPWAVSLCHNTASVATCESQTLSRTSRGPVRTCAILSGDLSSGHSREIRCCGDLVISSISRCFRAVLRFSHWRTVWNVSTTFSQFRLLKISGWPPTPASDHLRRDISRLYGMKSSMIDFPPAWKSPLP